MDTITVLCDLTLKGHLYSVPENVPKKHLWDKDCEQGWYLRDRLIADGTPPHSLNVCEYPAVSVTPEKLTTSHCVMGLQWDMSCGQSGYSYKAKYVVLKDAQLTGSGDGNLPDWLIPLVIGAVVLVLAVMVILVCYRNRKKNRGFLSRTRYGTPKSVSYIAGQQAEGKADIV